MTFCVITKNHPPPKKCTDMTRATMYNIRTPLKRATDKLKNELIKDGGSLELITRRDHEMTFKPCLNSVRNGSFYRRIIKP